MSKNMLMIVCDDDDKNEIIDIIMDTAQTGESGNSGDGRIFVLPVESLIQFLHRVKMINEKIRVCKGGRHENDLL